MVAYAPCHGEQEIPHGSVRRRMALHPPASAWPRRVGPPQASWLTGDPRRRLLRVSAGTYVFVPRGTVHAYKVIGPERGRVYSAFVPGGPERGFEEFVKLRTEGEEVNRSARRRRTVAQMNEMFAELNEKYDSEFVGPPL